MNKKQNNQWGIKQSEMLSGFLLTISNSCFTGLMIVAIVGYFEHQLRFSEAIGLFSVGICVTVLLFILSVYVSKSAFKKSEEVKKDDLDKKGDSKRRIQK